jgi:corrinoid protein of di/trimethylamine methyltransferase
MNERENLFETLNEAMVNLEEERVLELTQAALNDRCSPLEILDKGLVGGIRIIGDKFEKDEFTLAHMVIGADIMEKAVAILEPAFQKSQQKREFKAKVIIGTAEGDIHDIGKKILATLLRVNGYEVIDLGRDVPNITFIEQVKTQNPDFLCMSALMTTTVANQQKVIELLKEQDLRDGVRVLVGGAALSPELTNKMGADGYGESAVEGVAVMNRIVLSSSLSAPDKEPVPVEVAKQRESSQ